jgi:hypothetical protein
MYFDFVAQDSTSPKNEGKNEHRNQRRRQNFGFVGKNSTSPIDFIGKNSTSLIDFVGKKLTSLDRDVDEEQEII